MKARLCADMHRKGFHQHAISMGRTARRQLSPQLKTRVAFEAVEGDRTLGQVTPDNDVRPPLAARWRDQPPDEGADDVC